MNIVEKLFGQNNGAAAWDDLLNQYRTDASLTPAQQAAILDQLVALSDGDSARESEVITLIQGFEHWNDPGLSL